MCWLPINRNSDDVNETIRELKESAAAMEEKNREWRRKYSQTSQQLEQDVTRYHKEQSRLETLKNIAERYDGYGNSIRRVMEQKDRHKRNFRCRIRSDSG